jgi:hypothetical protein
MPLPAWVEAFDEIVEFIERFWGPRLRRLKQVAEAAERNKAKDMSDIRLKTPIQGG